jgi:predicted TIM-barrel enzyme
MSNGLVLVNDGEVAVFIPFKFHGGKETYKSYDHTCVQRRVNMTTDEFLSKYGVADGTAQEKQKMLTALNITEDEMVEAMHKAATDSQEFQNLVKLVRACRERGTARTGAASF